MKFSVTIPNWREGCPLTIKNIEVDSPEAARQHVISWVNRYAGYHYCDDLPEGTQIIKETQDA